MALFLTDPDLEERLREERKMTGADRWDEIWDGVYVIVPLPDNDHQELVYQLAVVFHEVVKQAGHGQVFPGINVSDRVEDWEKNVRVPDGAVFLKSGGATSHDTHWTGGADFLVEIVTLGDRSREKLDFYGKLGVRELLLVDRYPWAIELYRGTGEVMHLVGRLEPDADDALKSEVLPLSFQLVGGDPRPRIEVRHNDGRSWSA